MQKVTESWCENTCKELSIINRLATVRGMNLPIRAIVLNGTKEEVAYVILQEQLLFPEKVLYNDMTLDGKQMRPDALYFYDKDVENIPQKHMEVDIHGVCENEIVNRFIKELHLKGAEQIKEKADTDALKTLLEMDYEGTLMKVLMNNMARSVDGVFDVKDLYRVVPLKGPIPKTEPVPAEKVKEDDSVTGRPKQKSSHPAQKPVARKPATEKKPTVEKVKEDRETVAEEESQIPRPTTKKEVKVQGTFKEELSEKEKEQNAEKLVKLQESYKEVSAFIVDSKDNRFRSIAKELDNAVATNVYKTQWCPVYLNISDDTSTELYAKLYELDIETLEFNKTITRQSLHLGCAFCGTEWDEDITFKPTGVFYAECPNCYTQRPYEKK